MAVRLTIALFSWLVACAPEQPEIQGSSQEVVNGTLVADGEDLAVVSLGGCTGTLISPRVVLTAAHCIGWNLPSAYFGNKPSAGGGTWIKSNDVETHPSVDLALFTLKTAAPTTPIPFNTNALATEMAGQTVRIVGFGSVGENQGGGGVKRQGENSLYYLTQKSLVMADDGSKTCYGDSGGPYFMVLDGVQYVVAATSGATGTCEDGLSYGTRVDPHIEWIEDYIAEHDPS